MKQVFPDFRTPASAREKIDRSNITTSDIVSALVEVDKAITRFEIEAESKYGMYVNRRIDDMISLLEDLKRRVNDTRRAINIADGRV
jgi:uncharacterized protein YjcR